MTPRSHPQQRLESLYIGLLDREPRPRWVSRRLRSRVRIEQLPPRLLLSAAPNLPPVNAAPAVQSIAEDTVLVFSSAHGNAISISDFDAGSAAVQVTLGVPSGALTLASRSGLTFVTGDGVADRTMTFTGTINAINSALDGLAFVPPANASGALTLTIDTNDLGNSGSGGALSDSDNVAINVTAANDAPLNHLPPAQAVQGGLILNLGNSYGAPLSISDVDAGSNPVQVSLDVTAGTLTLGSTAGLSFTNGNGSNDASMTFQGTVAAINAALDGLAYTPPLILLGNVNLTITTNDLGNSGAAGPQTDSDILVLGSAPSNNAPVNTVPGSQTIAEDGNLIFGAGNGNAISIDDPDAGAGAMKLSLTTTDGTLTLSDAVNLTFVTGSGMADASMSFTGTRDALNNALNGLVFTPTADFNGSASVQITTNDQGNSGSGGARSASSTVPITVTPVNDAPALNLPASQTINEDQPLTFSSGTGNAILASDPDAGSGSVRMTISASDGNLTLASTSGLTFSSGTGAGDGSMIFDGDLASINAALDGLTFEPDANYNGSASLSVSVSDQGNTGAGGAHSASGRIDLSLTPVNDTLSFKDPGDRYTAEDTPIRYSIASGNAITISDVDAGNGALIVTLTEPDGLLTLGDASGVTILSGDGVQDSVVTFRGTLTALNAALDGLVFLPKHNFNGGTTLQMYGLDLGNTGAGGALAASRPEFVGVTAVNDAPVNHVPSTVAVPEDRGLTLSDSNRLSISDVDAGSGLMRVMLSATHGVLTLNGNTGLTFVIGDGTADANLTMEGTLANINQALDGMRFTPEAGFHGLAQIRIITNDRGNNGSGGALSDDDTLTITVDNPPTSDGIPPIHVSQDAPPSSLNLPDYFSDQDDAPQTLNYAVVSNTNPRLFSSVVIDATSHELTTAYAKRANGSATLTIRVTDASGQSIEVPLTVQVDPVNHDSQVPVVVPGGENAPPLHPAPILTSPATAPAEVLTIDQADQKKDVLVIVAPSSPDGSTPAAAGTRRGSGISAGNTAEAAAPSAKSENTQPPGAQQAQTAQPPVNGKASTAHPPEAATPQVVVANPVATASPPSMAPLAGPPAAPSAEPVKFVSAPSGKLSKELDQFHEQMTQATTTLHLVAGTASFVTLGMSIVYVLWTIRAGYLMASLLSSMPAWRIIDPLPILDHFEDDTQRRRRKADEDSESLQTLVEQLGPAREMGRGNETEDTQGASS